MTNPISPTTTKQTTEEAEEAKRKKEGKYLRKTIHWFRGEGSGQVAKVARVILAVAISIILVPSLVGIGLIIEGVKEWKRQVSKR